MRFSHHLCSVIEKLRLFLVILEEGSLRRAAERLHISQSAITRQIQLLEHDLGGRLLERTSVGVRPTNGGQTLARKSKNPFAQYDSVMAGDRPFGSRGKRSLANWLCCVGRAGISGPGACRAAAQVPKAQSQNARSNAGRDDHRPAARRD